MGTPAKATWQDFIGGISPSIRLEADKKAERKPFGHVEVYRFPGEARYLAGAYAARAQEGSVQGGESLPPCFVWRNFIFKGPPEVLRRLQERLRD